MNGKAVRLIPYYQYSGVLKVIYHSETRDVLPVFGLKSGKALAERLNAVHIKLQKHRANPEADPRSREARWTPTEADF